MRLLLDTHALLWWLDGDRRLPIKVRRAIADKSNAILVSLMGGLGGIAAGIGLAQLVNGQELNGQALQTLVTGQSIMLAAGVSAAIGLFFGIYPASRAARLNPIQALGYE